MFFNLDNLLPLFSTMIETANQKQLLQALDLLRNFLVKVENRIKEIEIKKVEK